jgi:hypothetical protein
MGLYTNPEPHGNGFISVKNINEIIQASVSSSNKKLVEICKSIPMNDNKLDKIRSEGTFRIPKTGKPEAEVGKPEAGAEEIPSLKGGKNVKNIKNGRNLNKYEIRWS